MQKRRVFLKVILGLGAIALPWSLLAFDWENFEERVRTSARRIVTTAKDGTEKHLQS